jgi:hypothetical protein
MCVLGNHQSEDSFNASDIYSPVLKAPKARLLAAIAAEYGCPLFKTDTKQAFLHRETTRYIFDRLTGGQSLFLKVMFSYFSKASMAPSKPGPHEGGTFTFLDGWRKTDRNIKEYLRKIQDIFLG